MHCDEKREELKPPFGGAVIPGEETKKRPDEDPFTAAIMPPNEHPDQLSGYPDGG